MVCFMEWASHEGMECRILIPVFGYIGNGNHAIRIPMDSLCESMSMIQMGCKIPFCGL